MPNDDHDPRRSFSADRPGTPGQPAVRPAAPRDGTFRLSDLGFHGDGDAGADPGADDPMQATVLDPDSWSSEVPAAARAEAAAVPAPAVRAPVAAAPGPAV